MSKSSEIPRSAPIPESGVRPPLGERLRGHMRAVVDLGRRAVNNIMAPAKEAFTRGINAAGGSLLEQVGVSHDKETGFKLHNAQILGDLALSLISGSTNERTRARQNLKPTASNMFATATKVGFKAAMENKK